ncbi:MAG: efflux RND transporter periplasmic adaptor subunit [Pseudomonadota bacterium]
MKRLMMLNEGSHRLRWLIAGIVALVIVVVAGSWFFVTHTRHMTTSESRLPADGLVAGVTSNESQLYICPMHPTYTSDSPGTCPICGMTLVLAEDEGTHMEEHKDHTPASRASIKVTDTQRQMIGVKTATAEMRSLTKDVRTVGIVAYDPKLAVAQREYIEALRLGDRTLSAAAAERLELMGMSNAQISEIARSRRIQKNLYLPTSDGKVWIYGDIYESDIPYVKVGQMAKMTLPGKTAPVFTGSIIAIDPIIDPKSRSMRMRVEVSDPEGELKPNLYVDVAIGVPLGMGLSIPESALIWSGGNYHVFIDEGKGKLVPRMVELGGRTRDYALIMSGLEAGDIVVTSPNFLIDSESQLKATLRSMKGEKATTSHQH